MSHCANDKAAGFALITALLYLAIITLVVNYALNSSLLQIKITNNVINQAAALQNAESALFAGENAVQETMPHGQGQVNAESSYEFIKLAQQDCAANYYQVNALGRKGKTHISLQSLLLLPLTNPHNCPIKYNSKKRLAWISLSS